MKYKITDFQYDQEKDQYICPDDKILELLESKAKFHHYQEQRYIIIFNHESFAWINQDIL
jgi:hypothetical protein